MVEDYMPFMTQAKSPEDAYSKLTFKIKKALGLDPRNTKIEIDRDKINWVIEEEEINLETPNNEDGKLSDQLSLF